MFMSIGKNLKRIREEKSLSQRSLAKRAQVSQQLLSSLENEIVASTRELPKIAAALGVHPSAIDTRFVGIGEATSDAVEVPILSPQEIMAGVGHSTDDERFAMSDLGTGDWIAMRVTDDAIDRVCPAGGLAIVNRAERKLEEGGLYLFSTGWEVMLRRFRRGTTDLLLPFSLNPEHIAIPYERTAHKVVGRCRRSVLEL